MPQREAAVGEAPAADDRHDEEHGRETTVEDDLELLVCENPPHSRSDAVIGRNLTGSLPHSGYWMHPV